MSSSAAPSSRTAPVCRRGRILENHSRKDGHLIVRGIDTLAGEPLTIEADLVVFGGGHSTSRIGVGELAQKLNVGYDENGLLSESHPKLRPVETDAARVFVCGINTRSKGHSPSQWVPTVRWREKC